MATLLIKPRIQFLDNNGNPLAAGIVNTYESGTITNKTTWKNQDKTIANTNPIILDDGGRADIWLDGSYKFDVKDSLGVSINGYPVDNIIGYDARDWTGLTATIADLNSTYTQAIIIDDDYTVTLADRGKIILCDCQSKNIEVYLPANVDTNDTFQIVIKKIDDTNNTVTIDPAGSETVDDKDTYVLYDYFDFIKLQSDCANWNIIAAKIRGTLMTITEDTDIDLTYENQVILIDASSNDITLNLDASSDLGRGYTVSFKRVDDSSNSVTIDPNGTETIDGETTLLIPEKYEIYTIKSDGSNWYIIDAFIADESPLPKGYITDTIISRDTDVDHDINISIGKARDHSDSVNLELTTALVKQIDSDWEEGTDKGGFPKAMSLTSDTWYFVFLIGKSDGTTDAGYDTDKTASNLLADADVVTAGYTKYRRVGSIKTDSSQNIIDFRIDIYGLARTYLWVTPALDVFILKAGPFPSAVETKALSSVPLGLYVNTKIWANSSSTAVFDTAYFSYYMNSSDVSTRPYARNMTTASGAITSASEINVQTNDSQQMKIYYSASINIGSDLEIHVYTIGWNEDLTKE